MKRIGPQGIDKITKIAKDIKTLECRLRDSFYHESFNVALRKGGLFDKIHNRLNIKFTNLVVRWMRETNEAR